MSNSATQLVTLYSSATVKRPKWHPLRPKNICRPGGSLCSSTQSQILALFHKIHHISLGKQDSRSTTSSLRFCCQGDRIPHMRLLLGGRGVYFTWSKRGVYSPSSREYYGSGMSHRISHEMPYDGWRGEKVREIRNRASGKHTAYRQRLKNGVACLL